MKEDVKRKRIIIIICITIVLLSIALTIIAFQNSKKQEETPNENGSNKNETTNTPDVNIIQARKPVIYLYPSEETEVSVKLKKPENLTHSYPKYKDEWKVIARPTGELTDIQTRKSLYCLYWEGLNTIEPTMEEGFIVKGEDTVSFLEEKLQILGLNDREVNEFIIYWLPELESNQYNYIRFQTIEQIEKNMPLEIIPKPDTIIRVMMEYKGLKEPIEVEQQKLDSSERNGFTVVEWGGTEIK